MRQTKAMRAVQPELKRIKKQAKGDRMVESQMTMALYKENGIKPMSSILTLLIQLPIFMAVFFVIRNWDYYLDNFTYEWLNQFMNIPQMIAEHAAPYLFGVVDLSHYMNLDDLSGFCLIGLGLMAAGLQFWQTRQTQPTTTSGEKKKMRDYFKDAAAGKEVDQSEMTAQMTRSMMYFFPIMTFVITMNLPGAVVLYYAVQAGVAVIQQHFILKRYKDDDLKKTTDKPSMVQRAQDARPAEIVKKNSRKQGGNTTVRRIKAGKGK
jgi:YidC/Oxa1 family membrane protein insertase